MFEDAIRRAAALLSESQYAMALTGFRRALQAFDQRTYAGDCAEIVIHADATAIVPRITDAPGKPTEQGSE